MHALAMIRRPQFVVAIICALVVTVVGSSASAHDLGGVLQTIVGGPSGQSQALKTFHRAYIQSDPGTRAVLMNAFLWPTPAKLKVCFNKGPAELRPMIASAMQQWSALAPSNVIFIFNEKTPGPGDPLTFTECDGTPNYAIRIGFERGKGHWSQIGTLSESAYPDNSMNLDFDRNPKLDVQSMIELTLHETGHALGFHHEHQSPGAPCTKWNWEKILLSYDWQGATLAEKEQSMHQNLDRLNDYVLTTGQHAYTFTAYDKNSIMHYSFPPDMFADGASDPCAIPQPKGLSAVDKEAMRRAYATSRPQGDKTRSLNRLLVDPRFDAMREVLSDQKRRYPDR